MKKKLIMLVAITSISFFAFNSSSIARGSTLIDGDVTCKCKKVFLGNKCAANGDDGNQCNGSSQCSEYDGNCH